MKILAGVQEPDEAKRLLIDGARTESTLLNLAAAQHRGRFIRNSTCPSNLDVGANILGREPLKRIIDRQKIREGRRNC